MNIGFIAIAAGGILMAATFFGKDEAEAEGPPTPVTGAAGPTTDTSVDVGDLMLGMGNGVQNEQTTPMNDIRDGSVITRLWVEFAPWVITPLSIEGEPSVLVWSEAA